MNCPVDKSPMLVVEHKKIELDYCPSCHGVWFDGGELGQFLGEVADKEPAGHAAHRHVADFLKGALQAHPRVSKP